MSNIIDLDLLVSEPIKFKISENIYEVPTHLDTESTLKVMKLEEDIKKKKTQEEQVLLLDKMVFLIFSISNEITEEWVSKLALTQKKKIMEVYKAKMNEINSDPN